MKLEKCGRCGVLYEQYNTKKNPKKCNGIRLLNKRQRKGIFEKMSELWGKINAYSFR